MHFGLNKNLFLLGIVAIACSASSCALLFPDRTAPKSLHYQVVPPRSPWQKILVGDDPNSIDALKADLAYENPQTGAIISINSLCRKYSEHNLEALTNNLVRGIDNRKTISKTSKTIANSEALDSIFEGIVDKVNLKIRTVVLIKNYCSYDFIYVSLPEKELNSKDAFEAFIASFTVN
jgi:hypothetical protein